MAVTDLTNLWSNVETVTSDYTPGQGAEGLSSDIKLQGSNSWQKRVDNTSRAVGVSPDGTGSPTSPVDLSTRHVCIFYLTLTPDILNDLSVLVYDGTTEETHCVVDTSGVIITDGSEYNFPLTGGWVPFWADVDRTGETTGNLSGSGATTTTAVTHLGHYSSIGNIGGGNLANTYLDAIRYSNSDIGDIAPALYAITGTTTNTIEDLRTAEQNTTTGYRGLLISRDGVDFFFGRLLIGRNADTGTVVATTFSVTDESFFFVSQRTMQDNWLGWTVNLGNASTSFSMTNCNFQTDRVTDAPVRPDLVFVSNVGTATITDCAILGLRRISLTSSVTMTGGSLDSILMVNSGTITNVNITSRAASASAMGTNFTFGSGTGTISNCTVKPAGTSFGHFVEFNTTGSHDFINLTFEDEYLGVTTGTITATGNNNACVHNSSGGTVTINVVGGSIPTVRNTNGSTTIVNVNINVNISGILGNSEIKVLPTSGSPYSGNTLSDFTTPIATERVSADTFVGNGIDYLAIGFGHANDTNQDGSQSYDASGTYSFVGTTTLDPRNTFAFFNFPGVLQDTNSTSPRDLVAGDLIRITPRDDNVNPTLQNFVTAEVVGTPATSGIQILSGIDDGIDFNIGLDGSGVSTTVPLGNIKPSYEFTGTVTVTGGSGTWSTSTTNCTVTPSSGNSGDTFTITFSSTGAFSAQFVDGTRSVTLSGTVVEESRNVVTWKSFVNIGIGDLLYLNSVGPLGASNFKTITVEKVDARFQFSLPANTQIDFLTYRIGSEPILTTGQTITNDNSSFPLSQTGDRNYNNPA